MKSYTIILLFFLAFTSAHAMQELSLKERLLLTEKEVFRRTLAKLEWNINLIPVDVNEIKLAQEFALTHIPNYKKPKSTYLAKLRQLYIDASFKDIELSLNQTEKQEKSKLLKEKLNEWGLLLRKYITKLDGSKRKRKLEAADTPTAKWTFHEHQAVEAPSHKFQPHIKQPLYTFHDTTISFDQAEDRSEDLAGLKFITENPSNASQPTALMTSVDTNPNYVTVSTTHDGTFQPFTQYFYNNPQPVQTQPLASPIEMGLDFILNDNEVENYSNTMDISFPWDNNDYTYNPIENMLDDETDTEEETDFEN